MANGTAEAIAAVATEAAQAAGERAAEVVAGTVASAEAAVADAAARVEAAEAVAQSVTDAALTTELGRQVADVQEELDEWEGAVEARLASLEARHSELIARMDNMQRELTEMKTVRVTETTVQSSTLPTPSATTTTTTTEAVVVNPQENHAPIEAAPVAKPAKKRAWI